MWNKSIKLPLLKTSDKDSDGFKINENIDWLDEIPASFLDVTRNDELLASQKGYTADLNIEIMFCNYQGQAFLVDEESGEYYDVRRTHKTDKSRKIVLTCEKRERGK